MTNEDYIKLLDNFPFLTLLRHGKNEYIGIVQNQDIAVISIYAFHLIKDIEHKKLFLELGEEWWWGTNRQIPINIILGKRFAPFKNCLVTITTKDYELIHGPVVSLRELFAKRTKRKNIQLIKKV